MQTSIKQGGSERQRPSVAALNVRDMTVSATSGSLKHLWKVSWRFQQALLTPLQNLQPFVATILCGREQIGGGTVTIDSVVFEPLTNVVIW